MTIVIDSFKKNLNRLLSINITYMNGNMIIDTKTLTHSNRR